MADAATINQDLLESFRISADDLRDLDALLRRQSGADIEYRVFRDDTVGYTTNQVANLASERNGSETRLAKVLVSLQRDEPALNITLEFGDGVNLRGRSEDRATLALLVQDIKSFLAERCRGHGSTRRRIYATVYAPLAVSLLLSLVFLQAQSINNNQRSAQYQRETNRIDSLNRQADERQQRLTVTRSKTMAHKGAAALRSTSPTAYLRFLVEDAVSSERQGASPIPTNLSYPNYPLTPWLFSSPVIWALLWPIGWIIGWLGTRLLIPGSEAVFLVGEEVSRRANADARRQRLVWGVGVALLVGISAGIVASLIVR